MLGFDNSFSVLMCAILINCSIIEKLPTPASVRRLGQVEVEMEQLSLYMPDGRVDEGAMDATDLPETIATTSTPDGSG